LNRSKAALPHFHAQSSPPRELCTKEQAQPTHRGDTRQCEGCAGSFVERLRHGEKAAPNPAILCSKHQTTMIVIRFEPGQAIPLPLLQQ